MSIERFGTTRRYSDIVTHLNTAYLVEVPQTLNGDITKQTRELLASVEQSLKTVGSENAPAASHPLLARDV